MSTQSVKLFGTAGQQKYTHDLGLTVSGVTVNGSAATYTDANGIVTISSPTIAANDAIVISGTEAAIQPYGSGNNPASAAGDASAANQATQITALGAPADAAYAGSGTSSIIAALKGIYAKLAASVAVTGTFWPATQPVSVADGSLTTLGAKADAKSTATDVTAISAMSVWKQISASVQAIATSVAGTLTVATHAVTQSGAWSFTKTVSGKSAFKLLAAATTNATSMKASAGTLLGINLHNLSGSNYWLKFYDKASAPTVGTDTSILLVPLPSSGVTNIQMPEGIAFATGIAFCVTTSPSDGDATAITAGTLYGSIHYA